MAATLEVGDADTQVLQFTLAGETYCIDVDYVAEVVERTDVTAVPNAPRHVEGVMDLRGETTTIVDPKTVLGTEDRSPGENIVVLDTDRVPGAGATGWLVDDIDQVVPVDTDDRDPEPAADTPQLEGVLKREDGFVLWLDPETIGF